MFGRGSPRFNMIQASSIQKRVSPKSASSMHKKRPSPKVGGTEKKKVSPKVDTGGHWNAGLEKALVDLLLEHNNDCYRGQNGWSSEAWNRICKLFNEKFSHIRFTKVQIQDKEKDLKRDYKLLKQAKGQSDTHWDEKLCMIRAEPAIWANIIKSFPKAKKFQNKSFPLFEALGELYDGQTAEGNLSFTSIEPSMADITQVNAQEEELENEHFDPPHAASSLNRRIDVDDDDDDVRIVEKASTLSSGDRRVAATTSGKRVGSRNKGSAALGEKPEKIGHKRKQDGKVVEMMGRFLEMKEKQAEAEDEFPIPMCIAVVDGMEDLSEDEKVDAYDVFKDEQNRAIFMTAKESTRLKWLRKKISQG